nr:MAG TPA: major capsid protein [Caudoviricetes sp.]
MSQTGINTGVLTRKMFEYIDGKVAEPKKGTLVGRSLFQLKTGLPQYTEYYTYYWKERSGQASDSTNRATDTTTVDVTYHKETGFITEKASALEYSDEEIARAQAGHIDVLGDKTKAANDALADWEDRLIFNGDTSNSKRPIYGLTSDPKATGIQVADDAPLTLARVVDPTNENAFQDAYKIVNWFMDAVEKITLLPGYSDVKPILALPPKEYKLLQRPLLNQYTPGSTIMGMLQDEKGNGSGAIFSQIKPVPEFEAKYWNNAKGADGKKDLGMIFLNDTDTANIPIAMEPQRDGLPEYTNGKHIVRYKERMGGLCIKFPAGFVRLNGIN